MLSELERRPVHGGNDGSFDDDLEEIGMLLSEQQQRKQEVHEKELSMFRSGSAPPTVEGSLNAVGELFSYRGGDALSGFLGSGNQGKNGIFTEDELRSDPEYLSYYYSNVNLNPRLPPPLLTKEDSRYAHRLKGGNSVLVGIGDRRKVGNLDNGRGRSIFMMPPGFSSRKKEIGSESNIINGSTELAGDALGLAGLGLGSKQKSIAEMLQDDFGNPTPATDNPSRPASRNTFDENSANPSATEAEDELAQLRRSSVVRSTGSFSYAAVVGSSLSRNASPDPQLIAWAPSPSITPI